MIKNLPNDVYQEIIKIGNKYQAASIVLFGSRARGDARDRSDIDLAVYNIHQNKQPAFRSEIDDIDTLLSFDIVFIDNTTSQELLKNIKKDGILLMDKFNEKYEHLKNAVNRLDEAIAAYKDNKSSIMRDGVIKRFEFCTELAWKTVREYLIDQGYNDINSPKSVMKTAFSDGLISDSDTWIGIIKSRNITSHLYNEELAENIYTEITESYINVFHELLDKLIVE